MPARDGGLIDLTDAGVDDGGVDSGAPADAGPSLIDAGPGPVDAGTVCTGNFFIGTAAQWNTFLARACNTVTGDLEISAQDVAVLSDPELESVRGALTVVGATTTTRLELPALNATGPFNVYANPVLADVELPAFKTITSGVLSFRNNTMLTFLSLPLLRNVSGSVDLNSLNLSTLELPSLAVVTGDFRLRDPSVNDAMTEFSLPSLTTVGGLFEVARNPVLTTLSLPALASGRVSIDSNVALTQVSLPALTTSSDVLIIGNALSSLSLPSLSGGNLRVSNTGLSSVDLPVFATGGAVDVGSDALTSVIFPSMVSATSLRLGGAALTSLSLPVLRTADVVSVDTGRMTTLTLPEFIGNQAATSIFSVVRQQGLVSLNLPVVTALKDLDLSDNVALTTLNVPGLRAIVRRFYVTGNSALRQCVVDAVKAGLTTMPSFYTASGNTGMPNTCP